MISHDLGDPIWMDSTAKAVDLFETLLAEGVSLAEVPAIRGRFVQRSQQPAK